MAAKLTPASTRPAAPGLLARQPLRHRGVACAGRAVRVAAEGVKPASRRDVKRQAAASSDIPADEDECRTFTDRDGNFSAVMCGDYGFRSGTGKIYEETDGTIPDSIWTLATENFKKEWQALKGSTRVKDKAPDVVELRQKLKELTLSNEECWKLEHKRDEERGKGYAPFLIKGPFYALCLMTDYLFTGRPIQRFWFLEEVARMPYMAYISMMHLYESLGWFRASMPVRKVHFAEEWNEMHHLMIMESLGGDQSWGDRFLAQHAAVFYFWLLCAFFAVSPKLAYKFSVLVEGHAIDTYEQFARENKEKLEQLPPPLVAVSYYLGSDVYMLDAFTNDADVQRRPACGSLYDVFCNIRDDEVEHELTMESCQENKLPKQLKEKSVAAAEKLLK
eukprot:jgi/Tetstr1/448383/TSEL_035663.t2